MCNSIIHITQENIIPLQRTFVQHPIMLWICTALLSLKTKETTHYIPSIHALVVVVVVEDFLDHCAVQVFPFQLHS